MAMRQGRGRRRSLRGSGMTTPHSHPETDPNPSKAQRGRGGSRGSAGDGGGAASRSRKPRRRRRRSEQVWVPPPNARSIWHEPGSRPDLQQQIAILQWRRAEVDARMKSVISGTRSMQEQDMMVGLAVDRTAERAQWMQGVIKEELSRPLYFDKVAMLTLESEAEREAQAARRQARNHSKLLSTVKHNVLRRDPALVKAALSAATPDTGDRSILGASAAMRPSLSLPALKATGSSALGEDSRKQLEELDEINKALARKRRQIKTKDDIVKELTRSANTHLKKKKKRKKKRSQRALHDTTGSFGSVPQSPEHTMSVGASAVSPS